MMSSRYVYPDGRLQANLELTLFLLTTYSITL